jgi:hypothetical protein
MKNAVRPLMAADGLREEAYSCLLVALRCEEDISDIISHSPPAGWAYGERQPVMLLVGSINQMID